MFLLFSAKDIAEDIAASDGVRVLRTLGDDAERLMIVPEALLEDRRRRFVLGAPEDAADTTGGWAPLS